ncbi:hypothetical protein AX16_007320 [Volvariella volvacea WC 439]|nr:hypothetical protein AX16_007320 [Volvariella volvacea WC 439]
MSQTQVETSGPAATATNKSSGAIAPNYFVLPIQAEDPLFKAVKAGDDKRVKDILNGQGFDLDAADEDGNTVLHHLILRENPNIVDHIFVKGLLVDVNAPNANDGSTPLHLAVQVPEEGMRRFFVETLLNNGAGDSTRIEDHNGKVPLDLVPSGDDVTRRLILDFNKQATLKDKVDEIEDLDSDDEDEADTAGAKEGEN